MIRRIIAPLSVLVLLVVSSHAQQQPTKLEELRKQSIEIEREIRKVMPDPNQVDPELATLQRECLDASRVYNKEIDDHPNLKHFKAEMDAATAKLSAALSANDKAAQKAAQSVFSAVMNSRMEAAAKEPDLAPLAKDCQDAAIAYNIQRKEFLANHPETKEYAAKLEEINAAIQVEMKKPR